MKVIPFDQTSYLTQVRRLREIAIEAVKQYPIKVKAVEFIKYGDNAIFKITDARNKKYLLRIHPANYHTKEAILEEFNWLIHILKTTDISVPKPLVSKEGHFLVEHKHPELAAHRYCALFEWIEGRFLWKGINKQYAYKVGALTAQLHATGKKVQFKHRHYWDLEGLVGTTKARYANVEQMTDISKKQQELITAARRCVYQKLKSYQKSHPEQIGIIHDDLNPNNIIINKNHMGVIDFDDCGIGFLPYDLTAPLFAFEYLTEGDKKKDYQILEEALYLGYSDHAEISQKDIDMGPYFMLARKLTSAASLELRKNNPKLRAWFHQAIQRTITYYKKNIQ